MMHSCKMRCISSYYASNRRLTNVHRPVLGPEMSRQACIPAAVLGPVGQAGGGGVVAGAAGLGNGGGGIVAGPPGPPGPPGGGGVVAGAAGLGNGGGGVVAGGGGAPGALLVQDAKSSAFVKSIWICCCCCCCCSSCCRCSRSCCRNLSPSQISLSAR